jgi:hypothetical protein
MWSVILGVLMIVVELVCLCNNSSSLGSCLLAEHDTLTDIVSGLG